MKTKNFFIIIAVLVSSFVLTSCSKEEVLYEYSFEEKGQMAYYSYTHEEWIMSNGQYDHLFKLYVFSVVDGDRLTGDYYYVNDGETEEIRFMMLYGEELVFFPGDEDKSVWNAKVAHSASKLEKQPLPEGYSVTLNGSTTANFVVTNIHGCDFHFGIGFDSYEASRMDPNNW